MRYYIADCHFYHGILNTKMDRRGFESVEAMNDYMTERWNQRVKAGDEVVILGDFSFGTTEQTVELLRKLNGRKYLVEGNHDRFLKDKEGKWERKFVWIKPYAQMHDAKRSVVLSHYPIMCYNGQYREREDGTAAAYMLYGHVHDTTDERLLEKFQLYTRQTKTIDASGDYRSIPCNMINCFCKYSDYVPLTLDEWIVLTNERLAKVKAAAPERGDGYGRKYI